MAQEADTTYWVAFNLDTAEPIVAIGNLGRYIPTWDNPMSAFDWAQAQSSYLPGKVYVREVCILYLPGRITPAD
jgi:hypothetical protein